ncbi:CinA family protein [Neoactinobaculum massilliense]|uniref:CinA family protein n=1 Tax=Neoactinobaculum massilliense TaxID=2364794 RepID=UPI001F14A424|nr:CinA family protein [Neoactinobaculum massilliense]
MSDVVEALMKRLMEREITLACAESLTGGLLAASIVTVPGVSAIFRGGVVSYATDIKASVLGVSVERLRETGAVDGQVALDMARGACRVLSADVALATTGVAGPGPSEGKPAGTVWIAIAGSLGEEARLLRLSGSRSEIRRDTVNEAFRLLGTHLMLPEQ